MTLAKQVMTAAAALVLAGCSHAGFGSQELHYATFDAVPAQGSTVHVCHAYGCRKRTRFTFTAVDLGDLQRLMAAIRTADSAGEERRAVAYAVGWMERRAGSVVGTSTDRAGMDFAGSGDPSQQDCVDEATNTTSYLTVLANAGLLRHHRVGVPFSKENFLYGIEGWTHWTAVLIETGSGQRWAVDSWIFANGENPAVVEAEKWYVATINQASAPPTAARPPAPPPAPPSAPPPRPRGRIADASR